MESGADRPTQRDAEEQLRLGLGYDVIRSYKRLSYTAWHALAEFVDNSTQSYFNNRAVLDADFAKSGGRLEVGIIYDRDEGTFRISDNSIGMSRTELQYALQIGAPPAITTGRSKYGMGLKTAACWLGNKWVVRTKKLGETSEYTVTVDVEAVAAGANALPSATRAGLDPDLHYTIIVISELNQRPVGRTIGKIKDFLRSMYRQDLRTGLLTLQWHGDDLAWDDSDDQFLKDRDGRPYKKEFDFLVEGRRANGWLAILDRGSRASAGFAVLHSGRVVRGWPESWRPESIYGQIQGSNDLVNQRVVGEIHLDDFDVTHTKDDILWMGLEDEVQRKLKEEAAHYVDVAKKRRKRDDTERGPSDVEIKTALDEFQQELTSPEIVDLMTLVDIPPPEVVHAALQPALDSIKSRLPDFGGQIGPLKIAGYLASDLSQNDPYVAIDSAASERINIILNINHPFLAEISGAEGFLNYLRQSTYDAVAEWKAMQKAAILSPDTIKLLKDQLLRLPSQIEMRIEQAREDHTAS